MGSEQNLREPGGGEGPAPKPQRPGDPLPVLYEGQRGEDRWVRIGFRSLQPLVKYRTKAPPTAFPEGCKASISPGWPGPAPSNLTPPPSSAGTSRERGGRLPQGAVELRFEQKQ